MGTPDQQGTVAINDNGTSGDTTDDFIEYTPAGDFIGLETFTYTVDDGNGQTDSATVSVTVTNANSDPPVARDDAFTVVKNATVRVLDVLADNGNGVDSDPDGDPLAITLTGTPDQGGSVTINGNGTPGDTMDDFIEYTPANEFVGIELFTYTIDDGSGQTDTATVNVMVDDSLLGHWAFDDDNADNQADDSSGNANHGAIQGPSFASGYVAKALDFGGVDDFVDLGGFDVNGAGLTISAWVNFDAFQGAYRDGRIVSKATGVQTQDHFWMLSTIADNSDTRLRFRLKTGGVTSTLIADSGNLSTGQWYHVAAVYDGESMRLYLDGVEVGSQPKAGNVDVNPAALVWIGLNPTNYGPFDGLIDDLRIHERGLSQQEIRDLGNNTPTLADPIADVAVDENDSPTIISLFAAFEDAEDPDIALSYSVQTNTNPGLFSATDIDQATGTLMLTYAADTSGTADITVRATDTGGLYADDTFRVVVSPVGPIQGDFNGDLQVNADDIDLLFEAIRSGDTDPKFELNSDGQTTKTDMDMLINDILGTEYGDANLDGAVSLLDLDHLADHYNQIAGWSAGDFSGDGQVSLPDLDILGQFFGFSA